MTFIMEIASSHLELQARNPIFFYLITLNNVLVVQKLNHLIGFVNSILLYLDQTSPDDNGDSFIDFITSNQI